MQRYWIWLICLVLFMLESTLMPWILPVEWNPFIHIAVRFVFVITLYTSLYINRHYALILGLVFGLLYDMLFYVYMIGLYTFGIGVFAYLCGLAFRKIHIHFISLQSVILLGLFVFEAYVFGIYRLFDITDQSLSEAFLHIILPSSLFNLLFSIIIYIPLRYYLEQVNPSDD